MLPKNKKKCQYHLHKQTVAKLAAKKICGKTSKLKNGYKVEIPNGKKPITVRIMNTGSGGRAKPYFRVSIDGKGSYTIKGKLSWDKGQTHIDLGDNFLSQITKMVNAAKRK